MFCINISKKLGNVNILCNFETDSGITALCGTSGAGKTSVINMIAGLITPDNGYIGYNNKDFYNFDKKINLPANKRFIGYVFQDARLFPNMSVKRNLLYGSERKSETSLSCSLEEVTSLLGINHLLNRYPVNLSGGEKQRVAIGRALLSNPEILLMDEPLASLDETRKQELINYIKIIDKTYNIPIIYVTHSVKEVMQLADKMAYMENGRLKYFGDAVEVLNKTALLNKNKSYSTVFEGVVKEYDSEKKLAVISFGAGLAEISSVEIKPGQKVRFSIDIHDVVLSTEKPKNISIQNIYKGKVFNIIEQESHFYDVLIDIGEKIWARVSNNAIEDLQILLNSDIYVMIKSAAISDGMQIVH